MVFTHAVADDTRALFMRLIGQKPHVVHGVEYPSLHGLQAVLHARQRPVQNDELRIREHGHGQNFFQGGDENVPLDLLGNGLFLLFIFTFRQNSFLPR